jgi:hypothetical protein
VNSSNYRKGLAPCLFAPLLFVLPTNTRKQTQRLQETNQVRSTHLPPMDYPNKELFPRRVRKQTLRSKDSFPSNSLVPTFNVGIAPLFFSRKKVERKIMTLKKHVLKEK